MSDEKKPAVKVAVSQMGIESEPKQQTTIYCGPTINNGQLTQYSVFKGDIPVHINQLIKKNPILGELFVSVQDFTVTRKNISIQGTRENQLYLKALENKGGNK